jgi:hypothetical protein
MMNRLALRKKLVEEVVRNADLKKFDPELEEAVHGDGPERPN